MATVLHRRLRAARLSHAPVMRLSLNETHFLFSTALRAQGFPSGALNAAVRMVQWAEIFHGAGISFLEQRRATAPPFDPAAATLDSNDTRAAVIDGGGQSALLVGPSALDLATERTRRCDRGAVFVTNVRDPLWLGQLAEQAATRGLACMVSFLGDPEALDAPVLEACYSPGRSIVAMPLGREAPLWIEMATTPASHEMVMSARAAVMEDLVRAALTPALQPRPGAAIVCWTATPEQGATLRKAVRDSSGPGTILWEPEDIAALRLRAVREGLEVDETEYYSLARFGLTTVIPSSEVSRQQAGADG